METKTISGIEVMASGTWLNGRDRPVDVSRSHLDSAIARFYSRPQGETVAIKLGHSSPGWNAKVAEALNVPTVVLLGEGRDTSPTGLTEGMARLGTITELERIEDSVFAKAEAVPSPVATMIEAKMYTGVSPEVIFGFENKELVNLMLTGVAFLGEQDPAIEEMRPLTETRIFARYSHTPAGLVIPSAPVLDSTTLNGGILESGKRFWRAFSGSTQKPAGDKGKSKSDGGDEMNEKMKKIAEMLGIDTEDEEAVLKAVEELQAKSKADQDAADVAAKAGAEGKSGDGDAKADDKDKDKDKGDGDGASDAKIDPTDHPQAVIPTEMAAAFAQAVKEVTQPLIDRLDTFEKERTDAKHEDRAAYFARLAASWSTIPGTPVEFGKQLADVESTLGEEAVNKMIGFYNQQNDLRQSGGLLRPIGHSLIPADSNDDPFEAQLKAYMEKNSVERPAALQYFATSSNVEDQRAFVAYQKRHDPLAQR